MRENVDGLKRVDSSLHIFLNTPKELRLIAQVAAFRGYSGTMTSE